MSNFQNVFLVTITEENDHYKNTKDFNFMTFNKFIFYKAFFFCCTVEVTPDGSFLSEIT